MPLALRPPPLRRARRLPRRTLRCALFASAFAAAPAQQPAAPVASPPGTDTTLPDAPSSLPGRLTGSVRDTNGDPIPSAQLTLVSPAAAAASEASAPAPAPVDAQGRFTLRAVQPGPYTLQIAAPGFAPVSLTGTVRPGQEEDLAAVTLRLAVSTTVVALDAHEIAAEQVRIQEQQKLIGILPNFFVSYDWYTPALSPGQKFHLAFRNAVDPGSFFATGIASGIQQATNSFPGYGQGVAGYGRRYGANYGNLVSGTFLGGAILPTLFHQDPRYFWKGTGSIRSRVLYAISRPIIQRGDNGKWQPAYSSVLGDLSSGALSNLYYAPEDRQGARLAFVNGFIGIGGDAINDLFQEFLLKRFTPKSKNLPPTAP